MCSTSKACLSLWVEADRRCYPLIRAKVIRNTRVPVSSSAMPLNCTFANIWIHILCTWPCAFWRCCIMRREALPLHQKYDSVLIVFPFQSTNVRFCSSIQLSRWSQGQGCTSTVPFSEYDERKQSGERMVTLLHWIHFQGYTKPAHQGVLTSMGFQSLSDLKGINYAVRV